MSAFSSSYLLGKEGGFLAFIPASDLDYKRRTGRRKRVRAIDSQKLVSRKVKQGFMYIAFATTARVHTWSKNIKDSVRIRKNSFSANGKVPRRADSFYGTTSRSIVGPNSSGNQKNFHGQQKSTHRSGAKVHSKRQREAGKKKPGTHLISRTPTRRHSWLERGFKIMIDTATEFLDKDRAQEDVTLQIAKQGKDGKKIVLSMSWFNYSQVPKWSRLSSWSAQQQECMCAEQGAECDFKRVYRTKYKVPTVSF